MRIRSIKPEFWRSDDIASLPITARLLFIGLWSYVDDNGVGSDKVSSIAADLFAADVEVDPTETFRRVSVDAACLEGRGLIIRYRAAGKPLLFVRNWERHQVVKNPSKGHLYPLPPAELLEPFTLLPSVYGDPTEGLGTGTGEQGSRGTEEQRSGGSAGAPLSPFCSNHPNGTEQPCRACATARTAYEHAKVTEKRKPTPSPFTVVPGARCADGKHTLLPDGTCTRCEYRAEVA